jgi:hypothetical protein
LSKDGRTQLASYFTDYRLAINALKHGQGLEPHRTLGSLVYFGLQVRVQEICSAKRVTSPKSMSLVDADEAFVRRCAQLIEETSAITRSKDRI